MSEVFIAVIVLLFGGGCFGFMLGYNKGRENRLLDEEAKNKLLKEQETANLLGPHAPEGGQTIMARLRQAGFTVLEKDTPPRAHMLGWLHMVPVSDGFPKVCTYCKSRLYEVSEVIDDPDQPFPGAISACNNFVCWICNFCGVIMCESDFGDDRVGLRKLFDKADRNNLFEILDHLQGESGIKDERVADLLRSRKQMLEREAGKIGDFLIQHEMGAAEEAADGPFRDIALPEPDSVPNMLKRGK